MTSETDVVVAGAGPIGLIAALAMARAGFGVTLVGPAAESADGRTTALMRPALRFLEELGIPRFSRDEAAPLATMRIVDGTSRLIRSPTVSFRAAEIGEETFGQNIPNSVLNERLVETLLSRRIPWRQDLVTEWRLPGLSAEAILSGGDSIRARLVAAADGRRSAARDAAGIHAASRSYPQAALVVNFAHTRDHGQTSTELHTETGPFTQVPLPGRRSSLVWVVRPETAAELRDLPDDLLSMRIEERMQSMLGRVTVEPGRQIYALSAALPDAIAQNRVALVGEAAHIFPPIGAQGMNLGIRDVADLVAAAKRHRADPGSIAALANYASRRRADILARAGAVNLLNMSLLTDLLPSQAARSLGLSLIGGFAPLRSFVMREGIEPGSGFSALASAVREQVGGKHARLDHVEEQRHRYD